MTARPEPSASSSPTPAKMGMPPPQRGGRGRHPDIRGGHDAGVARPFRARGVLCVRGPRGFTPGFHRLPRWGMNAVALHLSAFRAYTGIAHRTGIPRRNAANGDSPGWSVAEPWDTPSHDIPPQRGGRGRPVWIGGAHDAGVARTRDFTVCPVGVGAPLRLMPQP